MSRWKNTLVAAAVCGLALSGCGSKENDKKTDPEPVDTPTMSAAEQAACDALISAPATVFGTFMRTQGEPKLPDWQPIAAEYAKIAAGTTGATKQAADTVVSTVQEAIDTKNAKLLDSDEFMGAAISVGSAGPADCGFKEVSFEVKEMPGATPKDHPKFHFVDIPKEGLEAGKTGLSVKNTGKSFHEIIAVRLKDSYKGSLEEWKKLSDQEMGGVFEAGTNTFIPPGATSVLNLDLTPGRYIFFCHIPLMDEKTQQPKMGPKGPIWHYLIGMATEVKVS